MTTVTVLPTRVYAAGDHAIGPVTLGDSITNLEIDVLFQTNADMTIWPNVGDTIAFDIELSMDGGVTWNPWFQGSNGGGQHSVKGVETLTMNVSGDIPAGTNRQMQMVVSLSAPIKTGATVSLL